MLARQPAEDEKISFANYKIDYSRCLGSGAYGSVYAVIPRPANEVGFFSSSFPYVYDYLFPAIQPKPSTPYCVKIFHSKLAIVWEDLNHEWPFGRLKLSLHQPENEQKTNAILRKHGISHIKFFQSNSYAQFKTLIKGKTFYQYLENKCFTHTNQFMLRKSFVDFLRLIQNPNLTFGDIHQKNIMYDEVNQRWEIVDGEVKETRNPQQATKKVDNISYFIAALIPTYREDVYLLFHRLAKIARSSLEYTQSLDKEILNVEKTASLVSAYSKYPETLVKQFSSKKISDLTLDNKTILYIIKHNKPEFLLKLLNK